MVGYIQKFLVLLLLSYVQTEDVKSRYYPRYHLAPPHGWMNDPNGFSIFKGEYHLFYQYNPVTSQEPGYAHWGHAKSKNLFTWEHLPIAMYPDKWYDKNGVFSGSAIVENDTMYIYYTSNLNHPNETPDHEQHQIIATSTDGVNVTKAENNPIISVADLQPNIRDPKVWKHGEKYYMVLGNSVNNTHGRTLLFTSEDKINWTQASVLLESDGSLGFMFECPDFFELNGKYVLLFSPQGIQPQGDKYRNLYQTGYVIGTFDYNTNKFTPETSFKELDHGHDFYATQTLEDGGRRIMVAWMDMWDNVYPERDDGFTGMMTIPRVLSLTNDGRLLQKPIREIYEAIGGELFFGGGSTIDNVHLKDKTGWVNIRALSKKDLKVEIKSSENSTNHVVISYNAKQHTISLDRGGNDGLRRTEWKPRGPFLKMKIFIDASSVEVFCGSGEVTFSSRFFPEGSLSVRVDSNKFASVRVSAMKRTVPVPADN